MNRRQHDARVAFSAAIDAFDAERELVVPMCSRAASGWELNEAQEAVDESPNDADAQARYAEASANCKYCAGPYTPEMHGEHVAQMRRVAKAFMTLVESFKLLAATGGADTSARNLLSAEVSLFRLDADTLDSGGRLAGKTALKGKLAAYQDALDRLNNYEAETNSDDDDPALSEEDDARLAEVTAYFDEFERAAKHAIESASEYFSLADEADALLAQRGDVSPRTTVAAGAKSVVFNVLTFLYLVAPLALIAFWSYRSPSFSAAAADLTPDFLVSTGCTIVISAAVLWLCMRYVARLTFGLSNAIWAAVIPWVFFIPLEFAAGYFFPEHLWAALVVTAIALITFQAFILRIMCRQQSETLPAWKAYLIATISMLGSIFIASPIAEFVLERIGTQA